VTTPVLRRRAVYLQIQLGNYKLRKEYGIPGLDKQIAATLTLLMQAEQRLAERGLYLTREGDVVQMPRERDKRAKSAGGWNTRAATCAQPTTSRVAPPVRTRGAF